MTAESVRYRVRSLPIQSVPDIEVRGDPARAVRRISEIVADFKGVQGYVCRTLPIRKVAAVHNQTCLQTMNAQLVSAS